MIRLSLGETILCGILQPSIPYLSSNLTPEYFYFWMQMSIDTQRSCTLLHHKKLNKKKISYSSFFKFYLLFYLLNLIAYAAQIVWHNTLIDFISKPAENISITYIITRSGMYIVS